MVPVRVMEKGVAVLDTHWDEPVSGPAGKPQRVSALMVTRGRPALAMRAIRCFLAQSHMESELVIVDDDQDTTLAHSIHSSLDADARRRIRHVRPAADGATLGELRNVAVDHASGDLVCQWDDDDLYHPERIARQLAVLRATSSQACSLWRHRILWLRERRLCLSVRRVWEGSLLCYRERLPRYPSLRRGEDSAVVDALVRHNRYVLIDQPQLYTYIVHGRNTFEAAHFEPHWRRATEQFEGERFAQEACAIAASLPPDVAADFLQAVLHGATPAPDAAVGCAPQ